MTFTAADKLACAERELRMRQQVYPRWVAAGKIKTEVANKEMAIMRAIAEDYRASAAKERLL